MTPPECSGHLYLGDPEATTNPAFVICNIHVRQVHPRSDGVIVVLRQARHLSVYSLLKSHFTVPPFGRTLLRWRSHPGPGGAMVPGMGQVPAELAGHPDRLKWNARYEGGFGGPFAPHPLAAAALSLDLPDGPVLELASGPSGSALLAAASGRRVTAVDGERRGYKAMSPAFVGRNPQALK